MTNGAAGVLIAGAGLLLIIAYWGQLCLSLLLGVVASGGEDLGNLLGVQAGQELRHVTRSKDGGAPVLAEDVGELVQTNVLAVGLARPLLHDDYFDLRARDDVDRQRKPSVPVPRRSTGRKQ